MLGKLLSRANETVPISMLDWAKLFAPGQRVSYGGTQYQAFSLAAKSSQYESNAVVFACEANRILLFSEARFQYQRLRQGRPAELWGDPTLELLEEPWPGHTTRDLLAQAELDVACHGNSYWVHDNETPPRRVETQAGTFVVPYLLRLDPQKVRPLTAASQQDVGLMGTYPVGQRLVAYIYEIDRDHFVTYEPSEVGHYMPYPDPANRFVGLSWLNACLPDIDADGAMTEHKRATIRNGGSTPYVITFDKETTKEQFEYAVEVWKREHSGPENAGKVGFLASGADPKTVGQSFEQLSLKATQGAGETRIAACAGVPAAIVGLSEGMQGSSLNAGNYGMSRRRLVDGTMRPLWGFFAGAMQSLAQVQSDSRLWYDDRDIPFLREDVTDQATILGENASTLQKLIQSGFHPDASVKTVDAGDLTLLIGQHSGLFSVQLQPPVTGTDANTQPEVVTNPARARELLARGWTIDRVDVIDTAPVSMNGVSSNG